MLSGPTEKKKVACIPCSASIDTRLGTPISVPLIVSTSMRSPADRVSATTKYPLPDRAVENNLGFFQWIRQMEQSASSLRTCWQV